MRNFIADCSAVAAMPGLEEIAEAIDQADPRQRRSRTDTVSLLILAAASRAHCSQEAAASAFLDGAWELARVGAAKSGRRLPVEAPTPDQLGHLLRRGGLDVALAADEGLNRTGVGLAQSIGMLRPGRPLELDPPARAHHVTADGTLASALSDVTTKNKHLRSRAQDLDNARISELFYGKPPSPGEVDKRHRGLPFSVVSTHGGLRQQRVVLGYQTYQDGNELGASMTALNRIIPLAGGGVHTVHYDRLMRDKNVAELTARHGVVPIVQMHKAAERAKGLDVDPSDDRFARGVRDQLAPKSRLRTDEFGSFSHEVEGKPCWHRLWMLDGQLRVTLLGQRQLTLDADVVERLALRRGHNGRRYEMWTTYRVPCKQGGFEIVIDMAQEPSGGPKDLKALSRVHAGPVRIVNERDPGFWHAAGRRSDSESTIRTIKHSLPLAGRASRLRLEHFLFDLVGAGLWLNARAWDVHVAQHTPAGQREHRRQYNRAVREQVAA